MSLSLRLPASSKGSEKHPTPFPLNTFPNMKLRSENPRPLYHPLLLSKCTTATHGSCYPRQPFTASQDGTAFSSTFRNLPLPSVAGPQRTGLLALTILERDLEGQSGTSPATEILSLVGFCSPLWFKRTAFLVEESNRRGGRERRELCSAEWKTRKSRFQCLRKHISSWREEKF